jgi:hypothetical protein
MEIVPIHFLLKFHAHRHLVNEVVIAPGRYPFTRIYEEPPNVVKCVDCYTFQQEIHLLQLIFSQYWKGVFPCVHKTCFLGIQKTAKLKPSFIGCVKKHLMKLSVIQIVTASYIMHAIGSEEINFWTTNEIKEL